MNKVKWRLFWLCYYTLHQDQNWSIYPCIGWSNEYCEQHNRDFPPDTNRHYASKHYPYNKYNN